MVYFKLGNCGWTLRDASFGNRIQFWEIAFELTKYNNFRFTILVDADKWRETKFIDFPYTEPSNIRFNNLKDLSEIDARYPWLRKLDTNESWDIIDEWPPYQEGGEFYGKWLYLITLKDKVLKKKIKELVKDRIGIHIRHWPIIDTDTRPNSIPRFDYEKKMRQVRRVMDYFPSSKFYLSTDVTYDKPAQGPPLPDFRKESHWISEIYRDYNVVDYRDIISVDELLPETVRDPDSPSWSKVTDDEGRIINTIRYNEEHKHKDTQDEIYDTKIKRDVVDLFSLIYCGKKFISSENTGPQSVWSDFVVCYRRDISSRRPRWIDL